MGDLLIMGNWEMSRGVWDCSLVHELFCLEYLE